MNYIQYMKPGGTAENKKETSKFIEWLNKAGKAWKDFWDKPVTVQYAYNPHAVVGNGGTPFSTTLRRGDFATQAAGALAVPATAVGVATVGVPATLIGVGTGIGAGIAGSAGGSKLIEVVGGDENAQEMVGDIAGFTLGALAGGKATNTYNYYSNLIKSGLSPKSIYTVMSEAMTPVKTSSAGIWTNRGTRSAKISEAELAGIRRGDRNQVRTDRGEMSGKRFRWIEGKLVPEYTRASIGQPRTLNWDISDGLPYTDEFGITQYKFRPIKHEYIDYTKIPITNWGDELPQGSFGLINPFSGKITTNNTFLRSLITGLTLEDKKMSTIIKLIASQIDDLPEDLVASFDNNMIASRFRQFYWNKGYSLSEDITQRDIAKIIAENYLLLTQSQEGRLKNLILWNGSPEIKLLHPGTRSFTTLREAAPEQFTIIRDGYRTSHFDNSGIYFNTQPVQYDRTRYVVSPKDGGRDFAIDFPDLVPHSVTPGDKQPYLINKVDNVIYLWPARLKTLPKNTVLHTEQFKGTANAYPQDPLHGHEFFTQNPENIKSLFPHPNLFVENVDGTWSMIRSWNNPGLHYKSGGKLNYLNLMKDERLRTMEARS